MNPSTVGLNFRPSVSGDPSDRFGSCGEAVVSRREHGQALTPDVVKVSEYDCT
jgi:hypothetical protein